MPSTNELLAVVEKARQTVLQLKLPVMIMHHGVNGMPDVIDAFATRAQQAINEGRITNTEQLADLFASEIATIKGQELFADRMHDKQATNNMVGYRLCMMSYAEAAGLSGQVSRKVGTASLGGMKK